MLRCQKSDGDLRIQAFMNRAFQWYHEAMRSTEDNSRYLYNMLSETNAPPGGATDPNSNPELPFYMGNRKSRGKLHGPRSCRRVGMIC